MHLYKTLQLLNNVALFYFLVYIYWDLIIFLMSKIFFEYYFLIKGSLGSFVPLRVSNNREESVRFEILRLLLLRS